MDTTIVDQAKLWAAVVRGDGLSPASRAALVATQQPIASSHQFPTLSGRDVGRRRADRASRRGSASSCSTPPSGRVFYKGGHDEGTGNLAMWRSSVRGAAPSCCRTDVRAERLYPSLITSVLGETSMRLGLGIRVVRGRSAVSGPVPIDQLRGDWN